MSGGVALLIKALLLTIVIEGIVIVLMTKSVKWLLFSVLVNALTNPVLNLCLLLVSVYSGNLILYITVLVLGELSAVAGEAVLYRAFTGELLKRCFLRSAVANAVSLGLGFIFMQFILA